MAHACLITDVVSCPNAITHDDTLHADPLPKDSSDVSVMNAPDVCCIDAGMNTRLLDRRVGQARLGVSAH